MNKRLLNKGLLSSGITLIALGWGVLNASASESFTVSDNEDTSEDTAKMNQKDSTKQEKRNFTDSPLYQKTFVGIPLVVAGLITKGEDTHFRALRNDYMQQFHRPFDNYTQYIPGAVMLGMKMAGVDSRSSWGRMLTSDVFSAAIMTSVVYTMKHSTQVMRPDGSDNHSFPSGHTATAFMTATMLTKEYGHISPWIGIGAYTFATGTGLMRIANNKHWLSDVLTGAGIGILSTELGYYLADLVFKEKGIHHYYQDERFSRYDKPSFVGLYLGVNIPLSHYDISEHQEFRTSSGSSAGLEGAYFWNPYLGVGGRFTVSNTHIITTEKGKTSALPADGKTSILPADGKAGDESDRNTPSSVAEKNSFDAVSIMAGPYFSYPITSRWNIGSKLLAGYVAYPKLELSDGNVVEKNSGVCFGSGISFAYKTKERYGIRFFLDYHLMPSHSKQSGEWMNTLAVGTSFGVNL